MLNAYLYTSKKFCTSDMSYAKADLSATCKLTFNCSPQHRGMTAIPTATQRCLPALLTFGFNNPILVDDELSVIASHGRLQAAKHLGLTKVPVVRLSHLSDAEKRAYILADNKIALNAGWDAELLSTELGELADLSFDIALDLEITGFETGEIDAI